MKKPSITIRLNASADTVTVDGHVFDRSQMEQADRNKLTRLVRDGFKRWLVYRAYGGR